MKNPYEEWGAHPEEVRVNKAWGWIFSAIFIAIIVLPPVLRNGHEALRKLKNKDDARWIPVTEFFHHPNPKATAALELKKQNNPDIERDQPSLRDHLRAFESEIDKAPYAEAIRQRTQAKLTAWFGEGNTKTVVGDKGRLYYQAAIDGLIGYGPLKPEPDSVMKDPDRPTWNQPLPVIKKFANQLKERGIELMLVPVPVKPMIYPEDISGGQSAGPVHHRDQEKFYTELREAGVEVVDLSNLFWSMKKDGDVFLNQDTHWTPDAMQRAAAEIAAKIKSKPWFAEVKGDLQVDEKILQRTQEGDLVEMLDLTESSQVFASESQSLKVINDRTSGLRLAKARQSPIVLLGDSFVNIYDDPKRGFNDPTWKGKDELDSEPLIGAGFAQHLAAELQTPLDVYTANGGGATAVRKEFADRADNQVRAKKMVVWVLASRDLLLSESPGLRAGVSWRDVKFSKRISKTPAQTVSSNAPEVVIEAVLKERMPLSDPKITPYEEAIFSAIFTVSKQVKGKLNIEGDEVPAYLWGFRKRIVLASGRIETGKKYRLTLVPWESKTKIHSVQKIDDLYVLSDWWFVEKIEPVE